MKKYALFGTAGFVASRHLRAIRDTGGELVAAFDPNDSVGLLDAFFPSAASFTEFERFDRHLEKLRRAGAAPDFLVICSPNYLHDSHVRYALRAGMDAICEKPLVINPWNLESLRLLEAETGQRVWPILQLRQHPELLKWKETIEKAPAGPPIRADLTYLTPRGNWYFAAWKGDESKSGGILSNIGVHLFDLLIWLFGPVQNFEIHQKTHARAAGFLVFERAEVRWFLSIERQTEPSEGIQKPRRELRSADFSIQFADGFEDLHTACYAQILAEKGPTIADAAPAIELIDGLRKAAFAGQNGPNAHPLCQKPLLAHPFYPSN